MLPHQIQSTHTYKLIINQLFYWHMRSAYKSGFLLTEQTRYSEQVYNKSINNVRRRINILSTASITEHTKKYPTSAIHPHHAQSTGLYAKLSKLSFDAEILQQDVKTELYELNKTKQYLAMMTEDVKRTNHKLQYQLDAKFSDIQHMLSQVVQNDLGRSGKLALQCEQRKKKNQQIRGLLEEMGRHVKMLEDSLGFYTGQEKIQSI